MKLGQDWILYVIGAWILLNIATPLIIASIDRLYRAKIDHTVSKTLKLFWKTILLILKGIIIFIFIPFILVVLFVKKLFPSAKKNLIIKIYQDGADWLVSPNFPKGFYRMTFGLSPDD